MRFVVVILLPLLFSGCATATLATLGTVAGLGATAVGTGANVYSLGKLDSAEPNDIASTWNAVNSVANELEFTPCFAVVADHKWIVRYADDRGATIDFTLGERTRELTRLRIDVGVFGDEPTARLLLQRIRDRLGGPTTKPTQGTALGFGAS